MNDPRIFQDIMLTCFVKIKCVVERLTILGDRCQAQGQLGGVPRTSKNKHGGWVIFLDISLQLIWPMPKIK